MNRRLRLALFLVALAAAGPYAAPSRAVDTARTGVTIAWFRGERIRNPHIQRTHSAVPQRVETAPELRPNVHPDRPDTLRSHSLFQRPPPSLN